MLRKVIYKAIGTASHAIGNISDLEVPKVVLSPAIKIYTMGFGINMDEAEVPQAGYSCFGDFFARRLKKDARVICPDKDAIISPCDGRLVATHDLDDDGKSGLVVKDYDYTIAKMVGEPVQDKFAGGKGAIIYLHPRDYHRVHVPFDGELISVRHIAGTRFPVAPWSEKRVTGLYEKNERMVFNFKISNGFLTVVMVAAFGVGNITSEFSPGSGNHVSSARTFKTELKLSKGDELGTFRLGSTVVLLWSKNSIENLISEETPLIFGEKIANTLNVSNTAGEKDE
ncbi:MAG: phosphatidylserine decarboxylase [Deltaproteobacteria bacterium]|nr:phosphatidylserine decarboxylase [Deltaproteobacteria bacterium]